MKLPAAMRMKVIGQPAIYTLENKVFRDTGTVLADDEIEVVAVDAELPIGDPSGPNTGCWAMFKKDGEEAWCPLRDLLPLGAKDGGWLEFAHQQIGIDEANDRHFKYLDTVTETRDKLPAKKEKSIGAPVS